MSCEVFINYKAKWKILSICEENMTRSEYRQDSQWSKKKKRISEKNWTNIPNCKWLEE